MVSLLFFRRINTLFSLFFFKQLLSVSDIAFYFWKNCWPLFRLLQWHAWSFLFRVLFMHTGYLIFSRKPILFVSYLNHSVLLNFSDASWLWARPFLSPQIPLLRIWNFHLVLWGSKSSQFLRPLLNFLFFFRLKPLNSTEDFIGWPLLLRAGFWTTHLSQLSPAIMPWGSTFCSTSPPGKVETSVPSFLFFQVLLCAFCTFHGVHLSSPRYKDLFAGEGLPEGDTSRGEPCHRCPLRITGPN